MNKKLKDKIIAILKEIPDPELGKLPGVESVLIDLTFEPAWTAEKMSKEARIQLGL